MTAPALRTFVIACSVLLLSLSVRAQTQSTGGQPTFSLYCASCYGPAAKGDGPMAQVLTKRPADLTRIAQRNGGRYPADLVAKIIDGHSPVKGHGGGEMPVWGDAFAKSADPEPASERIARLVAYLESIQRQP